MAKSSFQKNLYQWYEQNKRSHPWRTHRDPYKIWLYEIIMQQTRITQGLPYYRKFVEALPDVYAFASAKEDYILKLWQGLGYYSRARNMHHAAKQIVDQHNGVFPTTRKELSKLKGIGPYTSAAIASFAYDEAVDVIDGNVIRVYSRVFGMYEAFDTKEGKQIIQSLSEKHFDKKSPAEFNQAIMDFGATQCTPKTPDCATCTMMKTCVAFQKKDQNNLPRKAKKLKKRERHFHYLLIEDEHEILIRQRHGKDIWQKLYELPYIEKPDKDEIDKQVLEQWMDVQFAYDGAYKIKNLNLSRTQLLTHQKIHGHFYKLDLTTRSLNLPAHHSFQSRKSLEQSFAFPKLLDWFLHKKPISLFD